MTDELIEFFRARLDEAEATAKAATPGPWTPRPVIYGRPGEEGWGDPEDGPWEIQAVGDVDVVTHQMHEGGGIDGGADAQHIALHDPARVLREVEADRRLLNSYVAFKRLFDAEQEVKSGEESTGYKVAWAVEHELRRAVMDRAAVWSDHPDYRQEWTP